MRSRGTKERLPCHDPGQIEVLLEALRASAEGHDRQRGIGVGLRTMTTPGSILCNSSKSVPVASEIGREIPFRPDKDRSRNAPRSLTRVPQRERLRSLPSRTREANAGSPIRVLSSTRISRLLRLL